MGKMKKKFFILTVMAIFAVANFVCAAYKIDDTVDGYIGSYPATLSYSMNTSNNTVKGYFTINSSNAPVKGKVTFTGTFRHVGDPDLKNYPLYKATFKASSGTWNVEIDTRMGTVTGKCKIKNKSYSVNFEYE